MEVLILILLFAFGLVFGSFFNVVIYRLPRKLSLVKPGSSCPQCGHALSPGELIPVVSFLVQGGEVSRMREVYFLSLSFNRAGNGSWFCCYRLRQFSLG